MTPESDQEEKGAARTFTAKQLRKIGVDLLVACGAPPDEATIVAEALVETSLMGLDSHGVMRYVQYAIFVRSEAAISSISQPKDAMAPDTIVG